MSPPDRSSPDRRSGSPTGDGSSFVVDRLLNDPCLQALELRGDEKVLDIGSGFGAFACCMAARAKAVLGVDRDETAVSSARAKASAAGHADRLEFRIGDAQALPLRKDEWHSFDIAHTRFLLESVDDPLPVVTQMVAAVRPGGRVVLTDDDHGALQLWPQAPRVMELWGAYMAWFDSVGKDSIVGRKLITILHESGARPLRSMSFSFGTCAGEASFGDGVARLRQIFEAEHEGILRNTRIDNRDFAAALEELDSWSQRPDATVWNVVRWAEGRTGERPGSI